MSYEEFYRIYLPDLKGSGVQKRTVCPFCEHRDDFSINMATGQCKCFYGECGFEGDVFGFLMKLKSLTFFEAKEELAEYAIHPLGDNMQVVKQRNTRQEPAPVSENQIASYTKALPEEGIQYLREGRGLTREVIDHYRIGWCEKKRFTIPIPRNGGCVNVRLYSPDKDPKILPISAGRPIQLYPEDQLENDELWLCEGELDALCAISHGLPAVSVTGGAGSWKDEFTPLFKDKKINIVYDCDEPGRKGAKKIAEILIEVAEVRVIDLGLGGGEDVTDWFVTHGKSEEEMCGLVATTAPFGRVVPTDERGTDPGITQKTLDSLLEAAIPGTGYIRDFVDTFSKCTDAPRAFLYASALVSLATILGNLIFVPWAGTNLPPNIWTIILGPSGYRKGTAIDFCRKVVEGAVEGLLLPQVASEEGLTKVLAQTSQGLITWQEFSKTLKVWNREGNWQASQEYWINLYDGKSFTKQLSNDRLSVVEPKVSLLSASIPKIFSSHFRREDLDLGFFGRIFFVVALEKDQYFAIPKNHDGYSAIVNELSTIRERYSDLTEVNYSRIESSFTDWASIQQQHQDELTGFNARIETHCMKLAMVYEASLGRNKNISSEALRYAIAALEFFRACMRLVAREEIGLSPEERKLKQIVTYVRRRKKATRSEVMNGLHLSAWEMDRLEKTLKERDLLGVETERTGGRPRVVYSVL